MSLPNDIYVRYHSFETSEEFKASIVSKKPHKIDIGAVFSAPVSYAILELTSCIHCVFICVSLLVCMIGQWIFVMRTCLDDFTDFNMYNGYRLYEYTGFKNIPVIRTYRL